MIKLTEPGDKFVWLNPEKIETMFVYMTKEIRNQTKIYLNSGNYVDVMETPEQVVKLIKAAK